MPEGNEFDVVILGAGSGGYACALRAAQLGLRVALVEKGKVGGTCLHVGCIPTKALLHAAEVADAARDSEKFGVRASLEGIDMPGVNAYKDARGRPAVQGPHRADQGPRHHRRRGHRQADRPAHGRGRRHVVRRQGGGARLGVLLPLAARASRSTATRVLTSEQALRLESVPSSVIVLGGGVIGCEFASVWRSFGAEVTIIEALPHLVPSEDEQSSKALERAFRKRKISFSTGTRFESVKTTDSGVTLTVEGGKTFEADLLLVAVGRGPVTDGLGYEEQGIAMERGFVTADHRCRTNVEGVYAVGDIVPGLQLAHRGFQQGVFVAEEIAGLSPEPIDETGIPRVTYCDPEVASVGLTEAQARVLHGEGVETLTYDLGGNGKSQILATQGFVKLVRVTDGPVVGVHMVGARVGELIGEAQLIYNWDAYPEDVAPLVHAHPTQNEALGEAHLALAGKPLHAHS